MSSLEATSPMPKYPLARGPFITIITTDAFIAPLQGALRYCLVISHGVKPERTRRSRTAEEERLREALVCLASCCMRYHRQKWSTLEQHEPCVSENYSAQEHLASRAKAYRFLEVRAVRARQHADLLRGVRPRDLYTLKRHGGSELPGPRHLAA